MKAITVRLWLAFLVGAVGLSMPMAARAALAAEEIVKLDDQRFGTELSTFLSYASRSNDSSNLPALWLIMDRVTLPPKDSHQEIRMSLHAGYLAQAICRQGSQADFEKLLALTDKLEPDGTIRRHILGALLDGAVRQEVADLVKTKQPPRLNIPPSRELPPTTLQGAPAEMLEAWRLCQGIAAVPRQSSRAQHTNGWISAHANWSLFFEPIADLLHRRGTNLSARIAQFEWGDWCGTGSDMLYGPKNHALFLALLREGNYAAALRLLFELSEYPGYTLRSTPRDESWRQDFIRFCGYDWETLYAGAVLGQFPYFSHGKERELARFGSERGARLLSLMGGVPSISQKSEYLRALGAFIEPARPFLQTNAQGSVRALKYFASEDYGRYATQAISSALQLDLLRIIGDKLQPGVSAEVAGTAVQVLAALCRPESKEALRRALALPYAQAQAGAQEALRSMGETVDAFVRAKPVVFRFFANGQPLPQTEIEYEVRMAGGRATSSRLKTDAQGAMGLPRELFADPTHPPTNVVFSARHLKSPGEIWFEVVTNAPATLDATTELRVTTVPLTLELATTLPDAFFQEETLWLALRGQRLKSWGSYMDGISDAMLVPFTRQVQFPALQPGRYQLQVRLPGAALWQSGDIMVGEQPVQIKAALERGADVRYAIIPPGKERHDPKVPFRLWRDGKQVDSWRYQAGVTNLFRSLPLGQYRLQVPGTAEQRRGSSRGWNEIIPPTRGYRGSEITFAITEQSPKVIDAGVIRLESE